MWVSGAGPSWVSGVKSTRYKLHYKPTRRNTTMSGEEQERFEDYLELEKYIEQLQAGHVAHPPAELTPSQASISRMAALFRSATPEGAEPRPEFAAELRARLEEELEEKQSVPTQILPFDGGKRPGKFSRGPDKSRGVV